MSDLSSDGWGEDTVPAPKAKSAAPAAANIQQGFNSMSVKEAAVTAPKVATGFGGGAGDFGGKTVPAFSFGSVSNGNSSGQAAPFGASSQPKSSFGSSAGAKTSTPFGSSASAQAAPFGGQSGSAGGSKPSVGSSFGGPATGGSSFGGAPSGGGSFSGASGGGGSAFGAKNAGSNSFASGGGGAGKSAFGGPASGGSAFVGAPSGGAGGSSFGAASNSFGASGGSSSTFGGNSGKSSGTSAPFGGSAFGGAASGGSSAPFDSSGGNSGFGGGGGSSGFGGSGFGGSSGGGTFGSFGGGGFGGGGESRPRGCFNCGEEGHRKDECPNPRKEREGQSRGCFNCGEEGHRRDDCPNPRKEREGPPRTCFGCGEEGHRRDECPNPKPDDPDRKPASTYIPEEIEPEQLYSNRVEKGEMFERFFDADVNITAGDSTTKLDYTPINSFIDLELTDVIKQNVLRAGYSKPTPIQQHGIPIIRQGVDMMACAQTGSGKTAAFLLPIMAELIRTENLSTSADSVCSPRCVVIAPTRELVVQIDKEGKKFANGTIMTLRAVFGGTQVGQAKQSLSAGATIIVATTGRLKHFVDEGIISLDKVKYLVLDEADKMLDMGFGDDVTYISSRMPDKNSRQTLMFSATFPDGVQRTASDVLKKNFVLVAIDAIGGANKCITQDFISCTRAEKKDKLLELLNVDLETYTTTADADVFNKKTLVFMSTKKMVDTMAAMLCTTGIPATSIHGDRLQCQRSEAVRDFTRGRKAVLVATGVAERGLDIPGVDHVINYDLPDVVEDYVHRIGRTGRAGNAGRATSFYVSENNRELAPALVKMLTQAEQVVPQFLQEEAGCGALGGGFSASATADEDENW